MRALHTPPFPPAPAGSIAEAHRARGAGQVLVLHGNATLMYNKFIQGDSDWIEARLTFPVLAPTTATVYFRR
jgi:hypothetical protein